MSIDFNLKQTKDLIELFGDDEDVEITVIEGDSNTHSGSGPYAYYTEYPEEGNFLLGDSVQEMPREGG